MHTEHPTRAAVNEDGLNKWELAATAVLQETRQLRTELFPEFGPKKPTDKSLLLLTNKWLKECIDARVQGAATTLQATQEYRRLKTLDDAVKGTAADATRTSSEYVRVSFHQTSRVLQVCACNFWWICLAVIARALTFPCVLFRYRRAHAAAEHAARNIIDEQKDGTFHDNVFTGGAEPQGVLFAPKLLRYTLCVRCFANHGYHACVAWPTMGTMCALLG